MQKPATEPATEAARVIPRRRGAGIPYPQNPSAAAVAAADRRHAAARQVATELIASAAATADMGYDVTNAGVHLQFTTDEVYAAVNKVAAVCPCNNGCLGPAAMALIGELALRAGGALATGRAPTAAP